MRKLVTFFCFMTMITVTVIAQSTSWKVVNMEEVTRHGANCEYDDLTCTATFTGKWDRWIDLPDVKGDLTQHTQLKLAILKSTCMLKVIVRYRGEDGKIKEVTAATLYHTMGKTIESKKIAKIDLTNKGKIGEDVLKNVVSIRISMAKTVDGNEEPWTTQFGEVLIL